MKTLSCFFAVLCLMVCLSGCAIGAHAEDTTPHHATASCNSGDTEFDAVCLRIRDAKAQLELKQARAERQEALEQARAARLVAKPEANRRGERRSPDDEVEPEADVGAGLVPARDVGADPGVRPRRVEPEVLSRGWADESDETRRLPPSRMAGAILPVGGSCGPGRTMEIENRTGYLMEVRGDDLHPCGDGGLAPVWVASANPYAGGIRQALVIPPHSSGLYYFYPYRQAGGYPVTTNGRKKYTLDVYDAGGPMGMSQDMPAAYVTTLRSWARVPFTGRVDPDGIARVPFTDFNVTVAVNSR